MGRSSGLFFGMSSVSLEDDDNDSAAKAFVWDSLSMSKKKRCLSTGRIHMGSESASKSAKPLAKWMIRYGRKVLGAVNIRLHAPLLGAAPVGHCHLMARLLPPLAASLEGWIWN